MFYSELNQAIIHNKGKREKIQSSWKKVRKRERQKDSWEKAAIMSFIFQKQFYFSDCCLLQKISQYNHQLMHGKYGIYIYIYIKALSQNIFPALHWISVFPLQSKATYFSEVLTLSHLLSSYTAANFFRLWKTAGDAFRMKATKCIECNSTQGFMDLTI